MIAGIVPANDLGNAKSRLKGFLNADERRELVLYLLRRVLGAMAESTADKIFLVTRDRVLQREGESAGAEVIVEPAPLGPSRAVDLANRAALSEEYEATLVVMSDLPMVRSQDVDEVIESGLALERGVAACRSIRGGTNALWRMPPTIIPSRYGENSFINHRVEAEKAGVPFRQLECGGMSLDLDAPEDFNLLLERINDSEMSSEVLRSLMERLRHQEEEKWQGRE